jgi:hypothetical protein
VAIRAICAEGGHSIWQYTTTHEHVLTKMGSVNIVYLNQLGSATMPAHATATAMHFPADAGLIFLTDKLTNDRYLVDTGAILSIIPCASNANPSDPLLKGANGLPIPPWGFITKTVQFQSKLFTYSFLQAAVAGPIGALIT